MNLEEYNYIFDNITDILLEKEDINFDNIDFILTKKKDGELKYIVGIEYNNNHFVYSSVNSNFVNYYDIKITRKYASILENNMNSFILTKLNDGYDVNYVELDRHSMLWIYISDILEESSIIEEGIEKYLLFCNERGVNVTLVSYNWGREIDDVYSIFIESRFNGYDIVLSDDIGEKRLILGIQYRIFFNPTLLKPIEDIIYRVTVYHKDTQEIEFNDYHQDISQAFTDYRNHFFGLNYSYYLEKEKEDSRTIEELKNVISAPLF